MMWANFRKALSKDYGVTRSMLAITIATYYFSAPITPWMPEKNDLIESVGTPHFKHARSSIYFFVNDDSFQCSFPTAISSSACSQFSDWIKSDHSAKVTYFWMRDRLFVGGRVLNSLEQDGKIVISSSDSQRLRNIIYEKQKNSQWIIPLFFSCLTLAVFLLDRYNVKYKSLNIEHE